MTFLNNGAESPGPDVGGGAIYAVASLDVTVVGSTFDGNTGSNGGAIGLLQSDGRLVNDAFENNSATGTGANYVGGAAAGCAGVAQANQGGAGGDGGAVSIDGGADGAQLVCGATFSANAASAFGGALFRTADGTPRPPRSTARCSRPTVPGPAARCTCRTPSRWSSSARHSPPTAPSVPARQN